MRVCFEKYYNKKHQHVLNYKNSIYQERVIMRHVLVL